MNQPPANPPDNSPGSLVNWSIQWDQWAKLNCSEWHQAFQDANTRQIHTDLISDFLAVRMLQHFVRMTQVAQGWIGQARYAQPMFYAVDPITVQPKPQMQALIDGPIPFDESLLKPTE